MSRRRSLYTLLGMAVWRGARVYVRWRLARLRRVGIRAGMVVGLLAAAGALLRRLSR